MRHIFNSVRITMFSLWFRVAANVTVIVSRWLLPENHLVRHYYTSCDRIENKRATLAWELRRTKTDWIIFAVALLPLLALVGVVADVEVT